MALSWVGFVNDVRPGNVGGIFEFLDTEAQNIIIRDTDNSLVSTYDTVDLGQWLDSEFDGALRVGRFGLSQFVPRHNYNGEIWAVGIVPTSVDAETGRFPTPGLQPGFYLFRYKYWQDLTKYLDSFDTSEQAENQIKDASFTVKNVGEEALNKTSSIFATGSRMICKIGMGDSPKMFLSTTYLDEVEWDKSGDTTTLTGRNGIGYFLSEQSFDEGRTFSGTRTSVVRDMLLYSGLDMKKVFIEEDATVSNPKFEPEDTLLEGLNYIFDVWGWKMHELPDGRTIIGSPTFHKTYYDVAVHDFNKDEAFTRNISQRGDGAYSRLALRSHISEVTSGDPPVVVQEAFTRTVFKDLPYFDGWYLGNRRTLYLKVIDNLSKTTMDAMAEEYAKAYQFIGITTSREILIHPEIQCGDVVDLNDADDEEYIQQGIITGIKHQIDVRNGTAKTTLDIDSGGTISVVGDVVTTYSAKDVSGDTRKRELLDAIRKEAKQKAEKAAREAEKAANVRK